MCPNPVLIFMQALIIPPDPWSIADVNIYIAVCLFGYTGRKSIPDILGKYIVTNTTAYDNQYEFDWSHNG